MSVQNYVKGGWLTGRGETLALTSAVTGEPLGACSSAGLDFEGVRNYAVKTGGPALRALTFHDRAHILKSLALYLSERKDSLYDLSYHTGATLRDSQIDIDGGIGTLFAYSSKGRREMPDAILMIDGDVEPLSKDGSFAGQHIFTSLEGAAYQINAFNFPCWGMLEKFAAAFLAGAPTIAKPAPQTCYLAEAMVRLIAESGLLPEGALQLICGKPDGLLDFVGSQDVVAFTGSAQTARLVRTKENIVRNATRFIAEQDSLNCSILGRDAAPGAPVFDAFVREIVREMTAKAGQKCTAIRRILVPAETADAVADAVAARLEAVTVGDPRHEAVRMGALVSLDQRASVRASVRDLLEEADVVFGDAHNVDVIGADAEAGAFMSPVLMRVRDPGASRRVHEIEAFGPVSSIIAYNDDNEAIALAKRGDGSLAGSVFTNDLDIAKHLVLGAAAYHGRLLAVDESTAKSSTGHGSPLPQLVHGGPGRAGGGEELGGVRGVTHYMQRTAIQGSPSLLSRVTGAYVTGAARRKSPEHLFTKYFEELAVGDSIETAPRAITLDDIERFAAFTGDRFYAHMDEEAAKANPFFDGRVAHGYLVLSFAAGLFVEPAPGPVLANYGLDNLRFAKPTNPGDAISVTLTVKRKTPRNADYGEVRWDVSVVNQDGDAVASYDLLTMNALRK